MIKNKKIIAILTSILMLSSIISKPAYGIELGKGKKTVYLTFDDGPSPGTTNEILKVLEKNNIEASFFVIGRNCRENGDIIKKMVDNGMTVLPHSDIHEYNKIYASSDTYFNDLEKCENTILGITGKKSSNLVRMPGGSDNTRANSEVLQEIKGDLISKGKDYIDWSLDTGDTDNSNVSAELIESRVREVGGFYKVEVVLMHDLRNKITTIQALQSIIDFYKERGYEFKALDNINSDEVEYLKKIRVINK